ncbi:MAG: hypothetical protein IJ786_02730 [Bacteroidaceae bacterium]|nr:hypothetical protein [Bacteroidaceae bacterium]
MYKTFHYMKCAVLALVLCTAAMPLSVSAQDTSMKDIYSVGQQLINYIEDQTNSEIVHIEYDIISNTKVITRRLVDSYTYTVMAFSDGRVQDLDLTVYKRSGNDWVVLVRDNEDDNTPLKTFTPPYSGEYRIEVKAYKFKSGYSAAHYGLFIYHNI